MTLIALVLSLCVAAFGAIGVLSPTKSVEIMHWFESMTGLVVAALFRVVLGTSLFYSAHASHSPDLIRILGILIFLNGVIRPFIRVDRRRAIVSWWASQGLLFIRFWAGAMLGFGLFLSYAVVT